MHRCLGCMREYKDEYQVCPYCGYEVGTPPKEAYHMVPGTLLAGRYTVGQVLGFGGCGVTYIGYDNAAKTAKLAYKEDISLKEACIKLGFMTSEEFDKVFKPEEMVHPTKKA